MPVRLLRPYLGQAVGTVFWGSEDLQDTLRATGTADDSVELATDYAPQTRIVTSAAANTSRSALIYKMNAPTAQTLTLNTSGYWPTGGIITVAQLGAGQVTVTPASGVTINGDVASVTIAAQNSEGRLLKTGPDAWVTLDGFTGQIAAANAAAGGDPTARAYTPIQPMRPETFTAARSFLPVSRTGLLKSDVLFLNDLVYTASDPNSGADVTDLVQQHLLDAYTIARGLKNSAWDNLLPTCRVRAVFPRGKYNITSPIVVPPYVDFDMRGTLLRLYDATGQVATTWNGDTTVKALANLYMPAVILGAASRCSNLNINCHPNGPYGGSGIASGKYWSVASVSLSGGAGFSVGDIVTGANGDVAPFFGFQVTINTVDANGKPLTGTLSNPGAYSLPPMLQAKAWKSSSGFDIFDTQGNYKITGATGTGLTASLTWTSDFAGGHYVAGSTGLIGDTYAGKIVIFAGARTTASDPTYFYPSAICFLNLNHHFDHIEIKGGTVGAYLINCNDVFIKTLNPCYCHIGLVSDTASNINITDVVFDSCLSRSFDIDKTEIFNMTGSLFWSESNRAKDADAPATSGNQGRIGAGTTSAVNSNNSLNIKLAVSKAGYGHTPGSPLFFVQYTKGSTFETHAPNTSKSGVIDSGPLFTSAVANIGTGVDASNTFEGKLTNVPGALFVGTGLTTGETAPRCGVRIWDDVAQGWCGRGGRYDLETSGAPTTATGQNKASKGSRCVDVTNGDLYINAGTAALPSWKLVTRAA